MVQKVEVTCFIKVVHLRRGKKCVLNIGMDFKKNALSFHYRL